MASKDHRNGNRTTEAGIDAPRGMRGVNPAGSRHGQAGSPAQAALIFVLIAALAAFSIPARADDRAQVCIAFFDRLDAAVRTAGVGNASSRAVPGYPHLRVDRFLAALAVSSDTADQRSEWLGLAAGLDLRSRRTEIRNLPNAAAADVATPGTPAGELKKSLTGEAESCSAVLLERDRQRPGILHVLEPRLHVPDEYSTALRVAGIYPVTSIPVARVTERVENRIRASFETDLATVPVEGILKSYAPPGGANPSPEAVEAILLGASQNPLAVPVPDASSEADLARAFAPVLAIDTTGLQDRIGRVVKPGPHAPPDVDPLDPVVYWFSSRAFLEGRPVLQFNYVFWTSGRRGGNSPRIERGRLDGLTIRITLAPSGRPFMLDAMNNCGCYHLFIPAHGKVAGLKAGEVKQPRFIPQWLPEIPAAERLTVRINTGWHQVERVIASPVPAGAVRYRLEPYTSLEALPGTDGSTSSLFDDRGIATGTGRIEPLLFFPMGIPSVGSMRQRSHHAITFLGRAHFDDPFLFDDRFTYR